MHIFLPYLKSLKNHSCGFLGYIEADIKTDVLAPFGHFYSL